MRFRFLLMLVPILIGLGVMGWHHFLALVPPKAPELRGALHTSNLEVDGVTRHFRYYVPGFLQDKPPVVFILHASGGDGERARKVTGYDFDLLADRNGFIAVYPDGFENHWNDCRSEATYSARSQNIDDVGFIKGLINYFEQTHQADTSRVYATGMSNGGHLTYRLAMEMPGQFAAIASVAANMPVEDNLDCSGEAKPLGVMIINGTADPINPYDGGEVSLFGQKPRGHVRSSEESVQFWRDLAGYEGKGRKSKFLDVDPNDGSLIELTVWRKRGKPEVAQLTMIGAGHVFPSKTVKLPRILGPPNHDINGAHEIWKFFTRHRNSANGA